MSLSRRWRDRRVYEAQINAEAAKLKNAAKQLQQRAYSSVTKAKYGNPYSLSISSKPGCVDPTLPTCQFDVIEVVDQQYRDKNLLRQFGGRFKVAEYIISLNRGILKAPKGRIKWSANIPPGATLTLPSLVTYQEVELTDRGLAQFAAELNKIADHIVSWKLSYRNLSQALGELRGFLKLFRQKSKVLNAPWKSQVITTVKQVLDTVSGLAAQAERKKLIEPSEDAGRGSSGCGPRCTAAQNAGASAVLLLLQNARFLSRGVSAARGGFRGDFGRASEQFESAWWSPMNIREGSHLFTDPVDVMEIDPEHEDEPLQIVDRTGEDLNGNGRFRPRSLDGIVIHNTAGNSVNSSIETLQSRDLSYHYIVGRDGTIYKLLDPHYRSVHAGYGPNRLSSMSRVSPNDATISIAFANRSWVAKHDGNDERMARQWSRYNSENQNLDNPRWQVATGYFHDPEDRPENCSPRAPGCDIEAIWETYPDAQVKAGARLAAYILHRHNLDGGNVYMHEDIGHPRGRKQDPGPLFPQSEFYNQVDDTVSWLGDLSDSTVEEKGAKDISMVSGAYGESKVKNCTSNELLSELTGFPLCSAVEFETAEQEAKPWVPGNVLAAGVGVALLSAIYVDLSRDRKYLRDTESTLL